MTRSSRLLAVGVLVLVLALVVLLLAMGQDTDPIVVEPAATEATDDAAPTDDAPEATVGALAEDEARLPQPLAIPAGHEAVAITAVYDAAVAGLPAPGDTVNVYGVFANGLPDQLGGGGADEVDANAARGGVVRTLSGVEVLGVSGVEAASGGGNVTLVLALTPADAERAIYLAGVERVWFSLVAEDHEAVDGAGVTRDTVLQDLG